MTLRQAVLTARSRLAAVPELADTAERDAALLLTVALRLPRTTLHADPDRPLTQVEQATYESAITRRLAFEPVQYIAGQTEFFGLELAVDRSVLIPRPETEGLVEAALLHLSRGVLLRVADVGTGSGAIALAVASERPQAEVLAIDISPAALAVARGNVDRLGLGERVRLVASDLFANIPAAERFDAVLSNSPYVPAADRAAMHPQVRAWEPPGALFAGMDGLEVYRRLIPQARERLLPGGLLGLEIGYGQQAAVEELLTGWREVQTLDDLAGIPRVVLARRPE